MNTAIHRSSGGIVHRYNQEEHVSEILLLHRKRTKDNPKESWHLPKGTQEPDEKETETALREIREETRYLVTIERKIGYLASTYVKDGQTVSKQTCYFACKPEKEITDEVQEHDEREWVPLPEAVKLLHRFSVHEEENRILTQWHRLFFNDV